MKNRFNNKALTIAGSDSGAGAGIQADLKTFSSLGVYGSTVITSITAQNTLGVQYVELLSPKLVESQIVSVMTDIGASSVKTGMLGNSDIVRVTSETLEYFKVQNLIIDPVLVAESGDMLVDRKVISSYITHLFPISTLVTPNIFEAQEISGVQIIDSDSVKYAGRKIVDLGAKNVLIKGGHLGGDFSEDFLISKSGDLSFKERRVNTKNTHGTGCTLSAAIAAYMSMGEGLEFSIRKAKIYLTGALKKAYDVGRGNSPVHHFFSGH